MKHLKLSILLLFVTFITACSIIKINTTTTVFYTPEFTSTGSIAVIPADIENNNSLEFSHYKQKIEDKLRLAGTPLQQTLTRRNILLLLLMESMMVKPLLFLRLYLVLQMHSVVVD